jgi:ribulose-phosphate 3-epimerase
MRDLLEGIEYEVHLMVANPEHAVPVWIAAGANRVIFHAESTTHEAMIYRATRPHCDRLFVAINPDTPISRLVPVIEDFSGILVMGVNPGKNGQVFNDIALQKVRALKEMRPGLKISIDGGVKPYLAGKLIEAGADMLVAGSALTEDENPSFAYIQFREAVGAPVAALGNDVSGDPLFEHMSSSDATAEEWPPAPAGTSQTPPAAEPAAEMPTEPQPPAA